MFIVYLAFQCYAYLNHGLWQLQLSANSLISSLVMVKICSVMVVVDRMIMGYIGGTRTEIQTEINEVYMDHLHQNLW